MSKSFRKDLTGQRFGRLTVLEFMPSEGNQSRWLCRCDCGNEKTVLGYSLRNGSTSSCGCYMRESGRINGEKNVKHGGFGSRLYKTWDSMKQRCYNSNCKAYKNYGGRGIMVCEEWRNDFVAFRDWALANGYRDDLTIDRIDNDGNYEPNNCRWADEYIQHGNTRKNIIVEYIGEKMCLNVAARMAGLSYATVKDRYHRGDRGERLFRPVRSKKKN